MHQCRDDDGKPLQPHADVDGYGGDDGPRHVAGPVVCQDSEGDDKAGDDHEPELRGIFAAHLFKEYRHFHRFVSVEDGNIFTKSEVEP